MIELNIEFNRVCILYNIMKDMKYDDPLFQSAYIETVILLNHILQYMNNEGKRINFTDDIETHKESSTSDITDLINHHRNAACHQDSPNRKIHKNISFTFNVIQGKAPKALKIGDFYAGSEYKDDIAIYYGENRVYFKRHIGRLLELLNIDTTNKF